MTPGSAAIQFDVSNSQDTYRLLYYLQQLPSSIRLQPMHLPVWAELILELVH